MYRALMLCLCIASLASAARAEDELMFSVKGQAFICLVQNADVYAAQNEGVGLLYIAINVCPEIPDNPLLAATDDHAPKIPRIDAETDPLLVLQRKQLKCLINAAPNDIGEGIYRLFPQSCRVEAR